MLGPDKHTVAGKVIGSMRFVSRPGLCFLERLVLLYQRWRLNRRLSAVFW